MKNSRNNNANYHPLNGDSNYSEREYPPTVGGKRNIDLYPERKEDSECRQIGQPENLKKQRFIHPVKTISMAAPNAGRSEEDPMNEDKTRPYFMAVFDFEARRSCMSAAPIISHWNEIVVTMSSDIIGPIFMSETSTSTPIS